MKVIRCGLLLLAVAFPTFAGAHYVEVWNPPEARGDMRQAQPPRKAPRHRHATVHFASGQLHHRIAAAAPDLRASVATAEQRARTPRYEDIPRQITPEGNVLRVDGHRGQAEVQR